MTRNTAKNHLKKLRLSQAKAAAALGVTREHLCLVLNGHRQSRRIMAAITTLSAATR